MCKVFNAFAAVSRLVFWGVAVLLTACHSEEGSLTVEPFLSDGAVLQQRSSLRIKGTAAPGSLVMVSSDWDFSMSATAGMDSVWEVVLTTPQADLRRHRVVVETTKSSIVFTDVRIGEVWLAIGQALEPDATGLSCSAAVVVSDSLARFFEIDKGSSDEPLRCVSGRWRMSSPSSFNGVGQISLSFIAHLRDSLKIPVGILVATCPDAPGKSWIDVNEISDGDMMTAVNGRYDIWRTSHANCVEWLRRQSCIPLNKVDGVYDEYMCVSHADFSVWPSLEVPGLWGTSALPGFDGVVWFFKSVSIPKSWFGRRLRILTGRMGGTGMVYANQTPVGEFGLDNLGRNGCVFDVPASLNNMRHGRLDIAVRMSGTAWSGGFYGNADGSPLRVELLPDEAGSLGAKSDTSVSIGGQWNYCAVALAEADSLRMFPMPENEFMRSYRQSLAVPCDFCGAVANKMVLPLAGKAVSGVLCNVGETEDDVEALKFYMPLIIRSVRHVFDNSRLPFFFPQRGRVVHNWSDPSTMFGNGVRETQMTVANEEPGVSIVSTLDLEKYEGRVVDYARQQEVGRRLARSVLASVYGMGGADDLGPVPTGAVSWRQVVNVQFKGAGGLRVDTDIPTAFEVAGADSVFYPARALAGENSLTVFSHMVPDPRFVRYAHHDGMKPSLWNACGLPAPSFFFRVSDEKN